MATPPTLVQATAALARGDVVSARALLRSITADAPRVAEGWLMRAVAALADRDLDDADACFRRVRELSPEDPRGPAGLGEIAAARGDTATALALLHEAACVRPAWSEPSLKIGEQLRANDPLRAGEWFLRAAIGEPRQPAAYAGLLGCAVDLRGSAPPPREHRLPRPLPGMTIVRSDGNATYAAELRAAVDRHVRPLLPDVEVLEPDAQERSRAAWLNRAIARARGDVVVVLRGDVVPCGDELVLALLEELMHSDIVGALGTHWLVAPIVGWTGEPYLQGWTLRRDGARVAVTMHGLDAPVSRGVQALDGTMLALWRELAQRLRFDEGFAGGHLCELELTHRAYRAGLRLAVLAPCAVVQNGPPARDGEFRAELARWTAIHPVPPPFPHRPVPGATTHVADTDEAVTVCNWLAAICGGRWRLAWELPRSPVA